MGTKSGGGTEGVIRAELNHSMCWLRQAGEEPRGYGRKKRGRYRRSDEHDERGRYRVMGTTSGGGTKEAMGVESGGGTGRRL